MLCRVILLRRNAAAQKHTKAGRVSVDTRLAFVGGVALRAYILNSLLLPEPLELLAEAEADSEGEAEAEREAEALGEPEKVSPVPVGWNILIESASC